MSDGKGTYHQVNDGVASPPSEIDSASAECEYDADYFANTRGLTAQYKMHQIIIWLVHFACLAASGIFFVLGCIARVVPPTKMELMLQTSTFSPLLKDVGEFTETIKFNGTFDRPSVYRGYPNASIDAAWKRITKVGPFSITGSDVTKMGKSDRECAQLPDDLGGGYMGTVEVFHQLHCLDMIRKYTYLEYYLDQNPKYWGDPMMRTHVDHCIEMLRQVLMCSSDLGIITYNFVEFRPEAWPDFNTIHQCRNFEKVLDWYHERELHATGTESHHITKSADSFVVATPP